MTAPASHPELAAVPLFALPNVVLFPRAVLPLHIFEERYKTMTADVLAGDKRLAMALLRPGWEKNYYQRPAIEPVVCVGEVLSWERLPDGKYNFLLQGRTRARVVREFSDQPYRVAELSALQELPVMEIDLERERTRLIELFNQRAIGALPAASQFRELLAGSLPTTVIADLVAFNFLEDVTLKQELLQETDVRLRVSKIIDALQIWTTQLGPGAYGFPVDPQMN